MVVPQEDNGQVLLNVDSDPQIVSHDLISDEKSREERKTLILPKI